MDEKILIILVMLEAVLVMAAVVIFLFLKNRKLARGLKEHADGDAAPPENQASESHWTADELQRTAFRQGERRVSGKTEEDEDHCLALRQRFLDAERQAATIAGQDENQFWRVLTEELSAIVPRASAESQDEQGLEALSDMVEEVQPDGEAAHLRERVATLQVRIESLEKFKTMFFDVKGKIDSQQDLIDRLKEELEKALVDGGDLTMLKATVEQLAYEKSDLQDKVAEMATRLSEKQSQTGVQSEVGGTAAPVEAKLNENTAVSQAEKVSASGKHMSEEVENMRETVAGQDAKIQELSQLIGELRLEVDDKERLKQIMAQLEGRSIDLDKQVNSLVQENNFLQDQISALLSQEVTKDSQFTEELQRIQERLASKESAYSQLEKKYTEMEKQLLESSSR